MRKYIAYLKYLFRHKFYVFQEGVKLKCPLHLLLVHDISKFHPREFFIYAKYFYDKGIDETMERIFDRAWLTHVHMNKHHWQYWILFKRSDNRIWALPIPERYILEMVADWASAGKAINGKIEICSWYEENSKKIYLHEETRLMVELLLKKYYNK